MLLLNIINNSVLHNSLNTRTITTKARTVATRITKAMKTAQTNRAVLESKMKTTTQDAIKAKAQQASTTLKLPKEHLWWSYWLLKNAFNSIFNGYNIWLKNMSQYRLFRWLSLLISYILWPIEKIIQVLAYFRVIRIFLLLIGFLLGLFTDIKEVKNAFSDTTGLLLLNFDNILGLTILKLQDLSEWFKEYLIENHVSDKQVMEKAIALPIEHDEGSWITNHKWEI